ncbi:MAG TPA: TIGR03086 family metal-binding protein [Ilumatobacter sp.]|nr:TIGR03086 family metal-binding protein [Ilumatobacter sp.]
MSQRTPLDALRRAIADFDVVIDEVERVSGWGRPTPCERWVASDVVAHLADWTPFLLEAVGRNAPDPADPPIERWRYVAAALQAIMSDPAEAATEIETGPPGRMPVSRAIAMFVTGDVVVHTWDLARSIDLDVDLDEVTLAEQLAGMESMEDAIRNSGHFGPRVDVPADASVVDRALAFTGRDPSWRPPE